MSDLPEGFREEWVPEDEDWRTVGVIEGEQMRCRWGASPGRRACGKPSVAALNRGRFKRHGREVWWWHYCEEHLYGRRIEDGQVLHRRRVPEEVA